MSTSPRFDQQTVVITGGNSGIGRASAEAYLQEGASVVITGRSAEKLAAAKQEINHPKLATFKADVAHLSELDALADFVRSEYGRLDVLFANAGVAFFAPIEQVDEAFFDQHININVKGLFFTTQKLLPLMGEGARILFNASTMHQTGMPNSTVYSATKAAVRSLARTLGSELAPRGIRVNTLSPGPIETPIYGKTGMNEQELQELGGQIQGMVPLGRFGRAEEAARAALFLTSTEASYITAADLIVDGGMGNV